MKELLTHMINGIIGEGAVIEESGTDGIITFDVKVPQEQMGIVIGRGGRTINAIKNVLKIRAIKEGVRVDIQVNEA